MLGSVSPLTSPEPSEPSPTKKTASKKRQRIDSEDEDRGIRGALDDEPPVQVNTKPRRVAPVFSSDEEKEGEVAGSSQGVLSPPESQDFPSASTSRLIRRTSTTSSTYEGSPKPQKRRGSSKAKGKAKVEGPPPKKKKKAAAGVDEFASELSDVFEELDVGMDVDDDEEDEGPFEEASEEEFDRPKSKGKGKGRGGKGSGVGGKKGTRDLGTKDILMKAKDESSRAGSSSSLQTGLPKSKTPARGALRAAANDEMEIDIVGGNSSPALPADGVGRAREERSSSAAPPVAPKKRPKLPTIKKNKAVDSAGPSTPGAAAAGPSKATASVTGSKDVLSEIKAASTGARKPAAYVGVSDLNLNNADIYTELFSKKGPNASRANEESKKKIEAMRAEWKAKREAELMQAPPFDLQAQQEKLSRFEEKLRSVRSAALYPNFLAGKWRELWERERNRHKEQASQDSRSSVNGVTNGTREEGELR